MNISKAYDAWSESYDNVVNRTRDAEARALREIFEDDIFEEATFNKVLEIGCGTGKNTEWYLKKAKQVVAVDFSAEMLAKACTKITAPNVQFVQADITEPWQFEDKTFDFMSFSLVLEHIENLDFIFQEAYRVTNRFGQIYIGELHPFKQYQGSKARFETKNGDVFVLDCFVHHVSDYITAARNNDFSLRILKETFDEPTDSGLAVPRILSLVFEKN